MLILTAHNKLVATNEAAELIQVDRVGDPRHTLVTVGSAAETRFDDGALAQFRLIRSEAGVNRQMCPHCSSPV